jgi:pimeloyl-ACP methyl ester carboxylesterase
MDFQGLPMREEAVLFGQTNSLVGILTHPAEEDPCVPAVILLNAGVVHRVGPARIYVKIARALAALGFVVLRFDFSGIGDSKVRHDNLPFEKSAINETQDAMEFVTATKGIEQFILIGGCSGARLSLQTACCDRRVVGALLMNFWRGPDDDTAESKSRLTNLVNARYYWNLALLNPQSWWKFFSGKADYGRIMKVLKFQIERRFAAKKVSPPAMEVAEKLRVLTERHTRALFVYSEGDPGLDSLSEAGLEELRGSSYCEMSGLIIIPRSDHTFSSPYDQERLLGVICDWAGSIAQHRC